jgi:hypothetical protein
MTTRAKFEDIGNLLLNNSLYQGDYILDASKAQAVPPVGD